MKKSKLKEFLEIYYGRIKARQKEELTLLWKAIKTEIAKGKAKKNGSTKPDKKIKNKKLEYDKEDWEQD